MQRTTYIVLLAFLLMPLCASWAQDDDSFAFKQDSAVLVDASTLEVQALPDVPWRPDPIRAVWLGSICPGLGQMYNRSWWKVPIVYGAFAGCGYAIMTNNRSYTEYKQAYIDITLDINEGTVSDDVSKSYNAILPNGYDISRMGGASSYRTKLQGWQNTYRRYRDISIVVTIVVYALSLVDAYVDAQLFDFDISPDLSMQVEPALHYDPILHQADGEVHLAIQF